MSFPPAGQARAIFPFTAVIGQEEMKLALILNVIDPKIGGVMIMGDRGTGKTTTIRALADLLPQVPVVAKDPFNSGEHLALSAAAFAAVVVSCEAHVQADILHSDVVQILLLP
jgi:Mg-chelatase subunit ChlI